MASILVLIADAMEGSSQPDYLHVSLIFTCYHMLQNIIIFYSTRVDHQIRGHFD